MAHGSEMRPPYINGAYQSSDGSIQPDSKFLKSLSSSYKKRFKKIEQLSDYVIGAPYSSTQFASKKLINLFVIGIPCIPNFNKKVKAHNQGPIRILHSPSHPAAKGSKKIVQVIDNLKQRGHLLEFIMLQGRPNNEVLIEIEKCDFIIDQIYSDTPMAGFAMEAAWFGKPAVVGGYELESLKNYFPEKSMYPPSQICHPDDLEGAIEKLIIDENYRLNLGNAAKKFVHEQWSADKVAQRYMRLINDDVPNSWWINPYNVTYVYGGGQTEEQTKANIQKLVNDYGKEALKLTDRPDLEKAFMQFAEIEEA